MLHHTKVSVLLTDKQVSALKEIARERQLSLSDVLREAVRELLEGRCN
jgi:Arc/MetJ-type ribon-helix-helix transcriptional regulator